MGPDHLDLQAVAFVERELQIELDRPGHPAPGCLVVGDRISLRIHPVKLFFCSDHHSSLISYARPSVLMSSTAWAIAVWFRSVNNHAELFRLVC